MSEPENFLTRWSRRKRATQAAEDAQAGTPAADAPAAAPRDEEPRQEAAAPVARNAPPAAPAPAFDPATLPPIDSITAETDIRAFLAPGVPPELSRAALRRAWAADPKIRDFVGLAENAWDFTAPDSIAGFGTLTMTDELRRQIAQMVGRSLGGAPAEGAAAPADARSAQGGIETSNESIAAGAPAPPQLAAGDAEPLPGEPTTPAEESPAAAAGSERHTAAQHEPAKPDDSQVIGKRSHGRALPKG